MTTTTIRSNHKQNSKTYTHRTSHIAHRTSSAPPHVRVGHRLPQYLVVGLRSAGGLGIVVGVKITNYLSDRQLTEMQLP